MPDAAATPAAASPPRRWNRSGSLTRRLLAISAVWIGALLLLGGYGLERVLARSIIGNFDRQLEYILNSMIAASEIGPEGEVNFNRPLADQRFMEAYSGLYFQITGDNPNHDFPSRSLWDRRLKADRTHREIELTKRDSNEFTGEPLRILERDVILPGSDIVWRFQVAQKRQYLDEQLSELRTTLLGGFAALGFGLLVLAALQVFVGLWPLRRVRDEVIAIRTGARSRVAEDFPSEIVPLVDELNELLAHNEAQAEEARRHAGNLAHALKTPLTVITNAATARAPDLADTVCREATTMRRQVDHHLARARAIGRRAASQSRACVYESAHSVERAVARLYEQVTVDLAGAKSAEVRVERQDLDEMLGNLIENAAKYGGGRVFVTVGAPENGRVTVEV